MLKYWILLIFSLKAISLELQLPQIYKDQNISGWVMSEKLDGIRGYWDGKRLFSKRGYAIHAPDYFTKNFPPFALDGELWIARSQFEAVQQTVLDDKPSTMWQKVTYNIFEVPYAKGNFFERLQRAKEWFAQHPNRHVHIIEQYACPNKKSLQQFLNKVLAKGGEGVVVKEPLALYHTGRSPKMLKVKTHFDAEGVVVAINPGKGRYENMMGSLTVEMKNGVRFRLGNGFQIKDRENPPHIGQFITFKYYGYTKYGKPKFASFLRTRDKKTVLQ